MKQINWGFIGCGEVTEKKSGPAFNEVPGSRIVAVMSRSSERARSYAEKHGIDKWYTDAQALIDSPEVNAVYIATPPSSHATYAIMAMNAGKPVYIEKPLAASYDDCVRINHVSKVTGVPCYVAYYRRYMPYFEKVKSLIDSNTIGKVLNIQISYACPPRPEDYNDQQNRPWRLKPEISGAGYFYDMAAHQIDLLQHFFGVIVRAHGYCSSRGGIYNLEDNVSACLLFENGLTASGSWCFVTDQSSSVDCMEIIGEKGSIKFSAFTFSPIQVNVRGNVQEFDIECPQYVQHPIIENVVKTLQGQSTCNSTCTSATLTNWVMDRILGKI